MKSNFRFDSKIRPAPHLKKKGGPDDIPVTCVTHRPVKPSVQFTSVRRSRHSDLANECVRELAGRWQTQ
eukprot:scaffold80681_cov66-Phaeocystis_antarctica.AAC.5